MLRFLLLSVLLTLIARAFWRVIDGVIEAAGGREPRTPSRRGTHSVKLARDPVCGTYVQPATALMSQARGSPEYFCSERCRDEYESRSKEARRG